MLMLRVMLLFIDDIIISLMGNAAAIITPFSPLRY